MVNDTIHDTKIKSNEGVNSCIVARVEKKREMINNSIKLLYKNSTQYYTLIQKHKEKHTTHDDCKIKDDIKRAWVKFEKKSREIIYINI